MIDSLIKNLAVLQELEKVYRYVDLPQTEGQDEEQQQNTTPSVLNRNNFIQMQKKLNQTIDRMAMSAGVDSLPEREECYEGIVADLADALKDCGAPQDLVDESNNFFSRIPLLN